MVQAMAGNFELTPPPTRIKDVLATPWRNFFNSVYEKLRGPLWEDMLAPLATGKPGGGSFGTPGGPTVINSGPYQAYTFSANDLVQVGFHIPHNIKPGSKIYPHVHWCTNGTDNGTATWKIHYQIAKGHNQEAFPLSSSVTLAAAASSTTAWQHMITECTDAQAIPAPEVDSLVLVGCELDAKGTGDTVFGLFVDIHYQIDRFGTPRKAPDFYKRNDRS